VPSFAYFSNERDIRVFKAGDVIFAEGDAGHHMFAVLEGDVEIRSGDRVFETITAGSIFGELALIDDAVRSATAIAIRDCRLAAVSRERFTALVQRTPYFALDVMKILADRLRRATST
jgi:CRP/FNR family transcriptional regulator, cyclic AMP receptor protein